ncbi:hypothetical protein GOODEAATRI_007039 [Goodea atripinnis]|uniref:Serine/threonine-protein kinase D1-3-like ubiquitin-like domain-containing protein n=1 Tax=Goodea atripinnis TaxID=208336 RepID=A0ABV0PC91_9TELE
MSASSPPSLPRAFLHLLHPNQQPLLGSPGQIYQRLSNGSHSVPSPTNSRSSFHGVSFLLQIGLTRETVNLEACDLSLSAVKDLVCSIVDQKDNEAPVCFSVFHHIHLFRSCFSKADMCAMCLKNKSNIAETCRTVALELLQLPDTPGTRRLFMSRCFVT